MAPILNQNSPPSTPQVFLYHNDTLQEVFNTDIDVDDEVDEKVSIWVKEKDFIRPSTNLVLLQSIESGVYTVGYDRDNGLFCRKLEPVGDELFQFSNSITSQLLEEINLFWDKRELYAQNKLMHKRGILLEGFPGTGKSSIISILSQEIISRGGVVFIVTGFRNLNWYVEFMQTGFRKIQPDTPIVTILEDIDQYEDAEAELLDFLDGKTHLEHHIVIATTNNTEAIPDTFLRPSRLDLRIEIPLPDEQTRTEYFQLKKVPEEDIPNLVGKSDKFSLADLKELYVCIYLLGYSVEDAITKIASPRDKKNYLRSPIRKPSIGI